MFFHFYSAISRLLGRFVVFSIVWPICSRVPYGNAEKIRINTQFGLSGTFHGNNGIFYEFS